MSEHGFTVQREIEIQASPETIWQLLTDPAFATSWMGVSASFDLRNGGRYEVEVLPGKTVSGEFMEIERPRRLVYSWGWENDVGNVLPGSSVVEIELTARGGGTILQLLHRHLPNEAAQVAHASGWDHYLPRLATTSCGETPDLDPWIEDNTLKGQQQ